MKKLLGKILIGLFCIGMIASCGTEKEVAESTENSVTCMEISETVEKVEDEELVGFPVIENDEENVSEEQETELPVIEETVEVEETEIPAVEEIPEVKEPEYSYSNMNQTMYALQSVNVRSLPSTDGDRVGGLSTAQEVTVTGKCNENGWYRIEYNGNEAFVSGSYLIDEKPVQQEVVTKSNSSEGNSSGGSSVTVPSHEDTVGNLVWVPTKGGKKYHSYSGCSGMEGPMQVTVEHAEALGFTPCKRCH